MTNITPLKRFGQNFLTDKNIIANIICEFNPKKDDTIIEIGPGRGALTEHLAEICENFTAVEIDKRIITELQSKFGELNVINKDILSLDFAKFVSNKNKLRIIGNIPYNITKPIILKLIENKAIISDAVLMVQYEVAKKLTSENTDPDYGILSVLMNYFTNTKISFKVSPEVFYPKPKISSAIIHIYLKNEDEFEPGIDSKLFIQIIKASFNNRRKTLKNSLSNSIFNEYNFNNCIVDLTKRAEQLCIQEFIQLTRFIVEQRELRKK
jgi:16S rRNA (adenine1518-N6/adenine1519-N6)-dimethyltransferase